jgi:hypothetical protein
MVATAGAVEAIPVARQVLGCENICLGPDWG